MVLAIIALEVCHMATGCQSHEEFVNRVRDIVASYVSDAGTQDKLTAAKLVYGIGDGSYRGICYYDAWQNGHLAKSALVEIAATGEESPLQLAGTTIHELAHVLAQGDGHGSMWKQTAHTLGLRLAKAAGTRYLLASFAPAIRHEIARLVKLADGSPAFRGASNTGKGFFGLPLFTPRPCPLGNGARGGKSRGTGSGSRLRKYECECGVKVRVASNEFKAHCDRCQSAFKRVVVN